MQMSLACLATAKQPLPTEYWGQEISLGNLQSVQQDSALWKSSASFPFYFVGPFTVEFESLNGQISSF